MIPQAVVTRAIAVTNASHVLVAAVLAAGILVFDPREGSPGRPKLVVLVMGAAVGILLLVTGRARRSEPRRRNALRGPVLAVVLCTALSAMASDHRHTALFGFPGSSHGLLTAVALAVLFFVASTLRTTEILNTMKILWLGAVTAVLALGVAQVLDRLISPDGGWDWARPVDAPWTIGSTLGNPNHLAGLLAMLLPTGLVLAALTRGRERCAVLAVGALAVAGLAVTASRGGWLAAASALGVLGLLFGRELWSVRSRVLLLAAAATASAVVAFIALGAAGVTKIEPEAIARFGPGSTLDVRREVWGSAVRMAADHPVLGVGPDVFTAVFPAYASDRFSLLYGPFTVANGTHNLFLNTLAELGVAGMAAFLGVLTVAALKLWARWRELAAGPTEDPTERLVLAAIAAGLVAYLVQASFNVHHLPLTMLFWVLLGWATAPRVVPSELVGP